MKIAFFDTHRFERPIIEAAGASHRHEAVFFEHRLTEQTVASAAGFPAICSFVNDRLNAAVLRQLHRNGTRLIALRSAGFNHVDLAVAQELGLSVARVPAYSPYSVAEHAVTLILALNRKICRASARIHELNFSLDGLVGFDLHGKTVGVVGTGRIGAVMARIMAGFGCEVLAFDLAPDAEVAGIKGVKYVSLDEIFQRSDILSLHVPLTPQTRHLIDDRSLSLMKPGVMLINTSRGALIDAKALIRALKTGHVGAAGLDVYEEEEGVFFHDLSEQILADDVLARLLTFPNVLITAHQAFLTREALHNIAETTWDNVTAFEKGEKLENEVVLKLAP
ncbi:MAG: 2-hydroxyacid dehydrogenase [Bdellovibrionaceae bacterium]|nr:2-hydroxyacid dehydrogenase [Pseudobdellovibrionaceae bacterium]